MQPFYPPHLKRRLALGLLLLLVVLLHLAGLQSVSTLWPTALNLDQAAPLKLSYANTVDAGTVQAPSLPNAASKRQSLTPLTPNSEAVKAPGLHAVNLMDEDAPISEDEQNTDEALQLADKTEPLEKAPVTPEAIATETVTAEPVAPAPLPHVPLSPAPTDAAPLSEPALATQTTAAEAQAIATTEAIAPATPVAQTEISNKPEPVALEKSDTGLPAYAGASADTPPWLTQAKFIWPSSTKFIYEVIGESKGIRFNADGDMLWKHDGKNYEMRLEIRHFLLGSKTQTSVGQLSAQGLQPKRFGDKFKQEVAAHFDRDKGQLIFSASSNPQPLLPAAQDRLSMFAQLPALLAGTPELRQSGQQISFQVVAAKSADIWTFQVDKQETVQLPIGAVSAWKLSRVFKGGYDQTADVWLSPAYGYLPVKVRIAQSNGDVLEQNLSKVQTP